MIRWLAKDDKRRLCQAGYAVLILPFSLSQAIVCDIFLKTLHHHQRHYHHYHSLFSNFLNMNEDVPHPHPLPQDLFLAAVNSKMLRNKLYVSIVTSHTHFYSNFYIQFFGDIKDTKRQARSLQITSFRVIKKIPRQTFFFPLNSPK